MLYPNGLKMFCIFGKKCGQDFRIMKRIVCLFACYLFVGRMLAASWDYAFESNVPIADQQAVTVYGGDTYLASQGVIWKYNKAAGNWSALVGAEVYQSQSGSGVIKTITVNGNLIHVGGRFDSVGVGVNNISANNVATYNMGTQKWSRWGSESANGVNGEVRALVEGMNGKYVGGIFSIAGSVSANNFARFSNNAWDGASGGITYPVSANNPNAPQNDQLTLVNALYCKTVWDASNGYTDRIYVGGHFARAGSLTCQNIAAFNVNGYGYQWWNSCGNLWQAVRSDCTNLFYNRESQVLSFGYVSSNDTLYISGVFSAINSTVGQYTTSDCLAYPNLIGLSQISFAFGYQSSGTVSSWGTVHPSGVPGRLVSNSNSVYYEGHLVGESYPFSSSLKRFQNNVWSVIIGATENNSQSMSADLSQVVFSGGQHRRLVIP